MRRAARFTWVVSVKKASWSTLSTKCWVHTHYTIRRTAETTPCGIISVRVSQAVYKTKGLVISIVESWGTRTAFTLRSAHTANWRASRTNSFVTLVVTLYGLASFTDIIELSKISLLIAALTETVNITSVAVIGTWDTFPNKIFRKVAVGAVLATLVRLVEIVSYSATCTYTLVEA